MEKRLIDYKDLTRTEKIDHIWEYYKLHIIGTICALFFLGWMLNHYIINPPPKVGFDVTFFGNYGDTDKVLELKSLLDPVMIEEGVNEETNVEFLSTSEDLDPNMLQATVTKMMGKASLKEYDIMVFEGESFRIFTDEDVLIPIGDVVVLPSKSIDESRYVESSMVGLTKEGLYLLDVSDKVFFQSIYQSKEPIYIGVYVSSQHMDKIEKALDYLLNQVN